MHCGQWMFIIIICSCEVYFHLIFASAIYMQIHTHTHTHLCKKLTHSVNDFVICKMLVCCLRCYVSNQMLFSLHHVVPVCRAALRMYSLTPTFNMPVYIYTSLVLPSHCGSRRETKIWSNFDLGAVPVPIWYPQASHLICISPCLLLTRGNFSVSLAAHNGNVDRVQERILCPIKKKERSGTADFSTLQLKQEPCFDFIT